MREISFLHAKFGRLDAEVVDAGGFNVLDVRRELGRGCTACRRVSRRASVSCAKSCSCCSSLGQCGAQRYRFLGPLCGLLQRVLAQGSQRLCCSFQPAYFQFAALLLSPRRPMPAAVGAVDDAAFQLGVHAVDAFEVRPAHRCGALPAQPTARRPALPACMASSRRLRAPAWRAELHQLSFGRFVLLSQCAPPLRCCCSMRICFADALIAIPLACSSHSCSRALDREPRPPSAAGQRSSWRSRAPLYGAPRSSVPARQSGRRMS